MQTTIPKPSVRYELVDKGLPVIADQARIIANIPTGYLESLGESLAGGQLQEIGLYLEYLEGIKALEAKGVEATQLKVIWGNCRVLAARLRPDITHLRAAIFDKSITETEFLLMRAEENLHRLDLTDFEKYRTCKELMTLNPDWQGKEVSAALKFKDASMLTRIVSLDRCIDAVKKAAEEGLLGVSHWYAISKLPQSEQAAMLEKQQNGATRDQLESAGHKSRNRHAHTVKVPSIKIALPGNISVTVKGNAIDLYNAAQALVAAGKQIRAAIADNLDASTAQKAWKCRNKTGS